MYIGKHELETTAVQQAGGIYMYACSVLLMILPGEPHIQDLIKLGMVVAVVVADPHNQTCIH